MNPPTIKLLLLLALWGVAVALAGSFNLLAQLPTWGMPSLVVGTTVGLSLALSRIDWLKQAVRSLSVRAILAVHLVRFVGFYFLWLHAQGRLPAEFAYRAGGGDIAAAVGVLGLLVWPEGRGFRRAMLGWNIFGALDLLVAVGTGGWLNITRPGSMNELGSFPLVLVPLWVVPILLSSHIYLVRQRRGESRGDAEHAVHA